MDQLASKDDGLNAAAAVAAATTFGFNEPLRGPVRETMPTIPGSLNNPEPLPKFLTTGGRDAAAGIPESNDQTGCRSTDDHVTAVAGDPGNTSELCKLLNDFTAVSRYSASTIYDAFEELLTLGVILAVHFHEGTLTVDTDRLFLLGYVIVFDVRKRSPVFMECRHMSYVYDIRPYTCPTVPVDILETYCLIKIKRGGSTVNVKSSMFV